MSKKRVLALAAAMLLVGTCILSGCAPKAKDSGKLDPKNPTVIEIWHYYNGPQKIAFDNLVEEFNETIGSEQGIVVETLSQGNVTELTGKVMDAANKKVGASDIPDVFAAYADTAYEIDKMGLVADIGDYLTDEELQQYKAEYLEEGRLNSGDALKIFPIAKSTEVFMLNKTDWDKFSEATGASIQSLSTIEGLTAVAEQYYNWTDSLTPAPDDGKAFFGRDAMANYFIIGSQQLGVEMFSVKDGKATLQCDERVFKKLWDNYYVPYVNGYFTARGKFRSDDAKTGDLIALVGSTSGAAYFPDRVMVTDTENYPIETMVLPVPRFANGKAFAVQQGAGMVVIKTEEKRERASMEFLKWFTEEQRNIEFSIGSGYLPVKTAANDITLLQKALEKLEASAVTKNLKASLPVAVETVQNNTLYTNKAFENGTSARNVLEKFMADQAKKDAESIQEQVKNGKSRKEAAAAFTTQENFQQWFDSFQNELRTIVQ